MSTLNVGEIYGLSRITIPVYTTTQRDSIQNPVAGEWIFNRTDNVIEFFDGTEWTVA